MFIQFYVQRTINRCSKDINDHQISFENIGQNFSNQKNPKNFVVDIKTTLKNQTKTIFSSMVYVICLVCSINLIIHYIFYWWRIKNYIENYRDENNAKISKFDIQVFVLGFLVAMAILILILILLDWSAYSSLYNNNKLSVVLFFVAFVFGVIGLIINYNFIAQYIPTDAIHYNNGQMSSCCLMAFCLIGNVVIFFLASELKAIYRILIYLVFFICIAIAVFGTIKLRKRNFDKN